MVLLALCDAKYYFTMFDVGQYGNNNNSDGLLNSKMGEKLAKDIPRATALNGCALNSLPYFLLGLTRCQ